MGPFSIRLFFLGKKKGRSPQGENSSEVEASCELWEEAGPGVRGQIQEASWEFGNLPGRKERSPLETLLHHPEGESWADISLRAERNWICSQTDISL